MPDFTRRSKEIEIMDDLNCKGEVVDQTLRELETINALLGGHYITLDGIGKLLKNNTMPEVSVIDVGCGGGDMLTLISKQAKKLRVKFNLLGIDANPNIIEFARNNTKAFSHIRYEALDIFSVAFKEKKADIITGTLFFHHFSASELSTLFRQLKSQAKLGIVINDIHRHWFAYYSIKLLTQIFSRSAMVKFDAPLSVMRAFKKKEIIRILHQAGIQSFTIRWMWAFRWQVIIY